MPQVYVRGQQRSRRVFHSSETCHQLTKRSRHGTDVPDPERVDLRELRFPTPCKTCYPEAPRAVSFHRFCKLCNTTNVAPCEHNGGVPVVQVLERRSTRMIMSAPGDAWERTTYVWPEKSRHFVL